MPAAVGTPVVALLSGLAILVAGLGLWGANLSPTISWREALAQAAWAAAWLVALERCYGAILGATTGAHPALCRPLGAVRHLPDRLVFVAAAAALVPLTLVAETCAQWAANHLLYEPGSADLVFRGCLRGLIDTSAYAAQMARGDSPLSHFARVALGWEDELHPFAIVVCAAMVGDLVWAPIAMAIGCGTLRGTAPLLARAFRLAGLAAATAPLSTLAYFTLRGGAGLNVWSAVFAVLVGTIDAGGQVPAWVRFFGASVFYLLPLTMVAWRVRADRLVLGSVPRRDAAAGAEAVGSRVGLIRLVLVAAPLVVLWRLDLSAGPWDWWGQSLFLGLWLVLLATCSTWIANGGARAPAPLDTLGLVALAWPLAVAGLVVQVATQWILVSAFERATVVPEFFGWFLGQARARSAEWLHPAAVLAPFLGNALWAWALLALARGTGRTRAARALRLGALQAATVPLALVGFMVLSIVTRDRAAPGLPRFDVWHSWTYLLRAALEASFATESLPAWLRLGSVGFSLAMPVLVARRWLAAERATTAESRGRQLSFPERRGADQGTRLPPASRAVS